MKQDELNAILDKHTKWLRGEDGGNRADLSDADLRYADLRYANLSGANLCGADLRYADLRYANLSGANLSGANLSDADLRYADLRYANLCYADLRYANLCGANLCDADLCGANLRGAKNLIFPFACPEKGSFIGWKKCRGDLIVELEICADAKRSSATGRKCRCDKAKVISITAPEGTPVDSAISQYTGAFAYRVGETVSVDNFDDNRWNECAPGIHFFITRQEAVDY
jgi:hypothetical protein